METRVVAVHVTSCYLQKPLLRGVWREETADYVNGYELLKSMNYITVSSSCNESVAALSFPYGEVSALSPASGSGKTAIGLYLKEESRRRLGLSPGAIRFIPQPGWELSVEGPLGYVEYISTEGRAAEGGSKTLRELLDLGSKLSQKFEREGACRCSKCGGMVADRESESFLEYLRTLPACYLLFALDVDLTPETLLGYLQWARDHSLRRMIIDRKIISLPSEPGGDAEFANGILTSSEPKNVQLVSEVIRQDAELKRDRILEGLGDLLGRASLVQSLGKATPQALWGEIQSLEGNVRQFQARNSLSLSDQFFCLQCGSSHLERPEKKLAERTLLETENAPLHEIREILAELSPLFAEESFPKALETLTLLSPSEAIAEEIFVELQLLSLRSRAIRDTLIYVDAPVSSRAQEQAEKLASLGNCIVTHAQDNQSVSVDVALLLPPAQKRPFAAKRHSKRCSEERKRRRISAEPLITTAGIERRVAEVYASLPEARVSNLSSEDFLLSKSRCPTCLGVGYEVRSLGNLGRRAEVCPVCLGTRYVASIQQVLYQGKSIPDLLLLTLKEGRELFAMRSTVTTLIDTLIGLGLEKYRLGDEYRLLPSTGRNILESFS